MTFWSDLADSELRQRLEHRGIDPRWVAHLVAHREHDGPIGTADDLDRIFGEAP